MRSIARPSFHSLLPPIPLAPLEPQPQASERVSNIWQSFVPNQPLLPLYSNFDNDAEFVPLEQQARTDTPVNSAPKPFDKNIDVVTSEVGDNANNPGLFFQHSFPFFGHDIFNSFGAFDIGGGPHQEPWWRGPNVCTEKEEEDEKLDIKEDDNGNSSEAGASASEPLAVGQFQLSLNSCMEKPNKYVCTKVLNKNGKKQTLTITRQCCRGYGRSRSAGFSTPCEKMEIKSIEETAADLDAKQFILSAKNTGELSELLATGKKLTIFAPTDKALNSLNAQLQNDNNFVESKSDESGQKSLLLHTVDGEISLDDVENEQLLKTLEGEQKIRINAYQMPPNLSPEPYRYTANCVPISKYDQLSQQAMIHTLDGVLKPVQKSVMDLIRERADLSIMRTVLENTKLSDMLQNINKTVTIFVPTDAAFDKLEPHLRRALKEGRGCATNILKNHILDLTFCSVASVPGAKTTAYNLLGEPLRFNRSASAKKSEVADLVGEQPVIINDIAKIIESDIMGTNGVLHIVDTILPTETALPVSTLMQQKNVTIFKRLLEASDTDYQFDDLENATIFAPTDKAFEGTKWATLLTESPEQLKGNSELLELLNYHVVSPMIKTCDLSEQMLQSANGGEVRVNLYSTHALLTNVMNRATVNCARLVRFDDESCGSVLHQVDKVLVQPKLNLYEMLQANPNYSKFLEFVRAANLSHLLSNMDQGYTVLVPKNEIFEEFEDGDKKLGKDTQAMENLVRTHIVNDVVCCAGIIPTNWPFVRSIETLNGEHLRITRDRRPKIENAGVTKCDNIATNGVIHEINDIIVTQKRRPRPQPTFHQGHDFDNIFF